MSLEDMTGYDRAAWDDLARWREKRLKAQSRHILPEGARAKIARTKDRARERFEELPGSDTFANTLRRAIEGVLGLVNRISEASLRRQRVVRAYAKQGLPVADLEDIRKLELRDIDRVKPRLELSYSTGAALEGAASGAAVSGAEIAATGGTVASAGAAAAPSAGLVVGALAVDAAAVLAATTRCISHTAAYYGYDTELPHERIFALGVLNFSLAGQAGKSAAYVELNKLVQQLARNATWRSLNANAVTRIVKVVYERLGMRLTKQKLGQAVPVVGILIGGGLNARLLAMTAVDADRIYRERFLREKYGLALTDPTALGLITEDTDEESVNVTRIVEEIEDEYDGNEGDTPPSIES